MKEYYKQTETNLGTQKTKVRKYFDMSEKIVIFV